MEKDTVEKVKQVISDTASDVVSEFGKGPGRMSSQDKAEHYAKMSLILGVIEWIPTIIANIVRVDDPTIFYMLGVFSLIGIAFLFPLNKELKWLEPEKRTRAVNIGTIAFFVNMLLIRHVMIFVLIMAAVFHFFIRIPGFYFFLFDRKTDTVHIEAPDELTRDYLSHEHEKKPSDPIHKALRIVYIIILITLFRFMVDPGAYLPSIFVVYGIVGVILRKWIGPKRENSEIGKSLMRLANLFMVLGVVTIIVLIIVTIIALSAARGDDSIGSGNARH